MARQSRKGARRHFGPGRNALLKAQGARGKRLNNLWLQYSPRNRKDVILRSDVEFDHFCCLEGDEEVAHYELEPEPVIIFMEGEPCRTQFDARVDLRSRIVQMREVKDSDAALDARELSQRDKQRAIAAAAGFEYVRFTRESVAAHQMLIENWRSAIPFLAACRSLVLEPRMSAIIERVRAAGEPLTLEQLVVDVDRNEHPVHIAALLQAVQAGQLRSDLAVHPFCSLSTFTLPEARRD